MSLDEALWREGYEAGQADLLAEMSVLRANLEAVEARYAAAVAALDEIADMCQRLIDETDIIDPGWVVQAARAAITTTEKGHSRDQSEE